MATATIYSSAFDGGAVSMNITYDTVSLQVQSLIYNNPTPLPGTVVFSGAWNHTEDCPANTNKIVDLTGFNVVCVQTQVTDKYGTRVITALPGAESVQFTWPT